VPVKILYQLTGDNMKSNSVLLIDNDEEFLTFASDFLSVGMKLKNVDRAVSTEDAKIKIKTCNPDIVILDLGMKDSCKLSELIKDKANAPILIISCYYTNEDYIKLVMGMKADGFFLKGEVKTAFPKLIEFVNTDFYDLLRKNLYIMN
jgi:DNA-binding NarL/FixJ family response regulator